MSIGCDKLILELVFSFNIKSKLELSKIEFKLTT